RLILAGRIDRDEITPLTDSSRIIGGALVLVREAEESLEESADAAAFVGRLRRCSVLRLAALVTDKDVVVRNAKADQFRSRLDGLRLGTDMAATVCRIATSPVAALARNATDRHARWRCRRVD